MNRIAKYSVALFSGCVAVVPAIAGSEAGVMPALFEPQYWVMALSTVALVALGVGRNAASVHASGTDADTPMPTAVMPLA